MAITIQQQPNKYNLVVAPQVWTLAGITTEDEYQLNIQTPDGNTIASVRQRANPDGVAHFDVSQILQSKLGFDFYEETQRVAEAKNEAFSYQVQFGTNTNNIFTATATSQERYVYNGYLDWRDINWQDVDFNPEPLAAQCFSSQTINADFEGIEYSFLTNFPESQYTIRSNSYHTLSFINRIANFDDGTIWSSNEQPAYVRIKFFDADGDVIQTAIYSIDETNGLGPRTNFDSLAIPAYLDDELVGVVGAGPKNLKEAGLWPSGGLPWNTITRQWGNYQVIWNAQNSSATVESYTIDIMSIDMCKVDTDGVPANNTASTLLEYADQIIYTYTFNVQDDCSRFEPVTVSWVNQLGAKDYFTFDRRNTLNVTSDRNNYYKSNKSWSSSQYTIDQHSGGHTTFSNEIETEMELSTNFMKDSVSEWLQELYVSPNIQVYYRDEWHPAVIESKNYSQKTFARDGLFRHNLKVKWSNNKIVQRG